MRSCSGRFTANVWSNVNTSSTDKRAHNDDGALAGLDQGQAGYACSNTRDGGRRERLETCALAPGRAAVLSVAWWVVSEAALYRA